MLILQKRYLGKNKDVEIYYATPAGMVYKTFASGLKQIYEMNPLFRTEIETVYDGHPDDPLSTEIDRECHDEVIPFEELPDSEIEKLIILSDTDDDQHICEIPTTSWEMVSDGDFFVHQPVENKEGYVLYAYYGGNWCALFAGAMICIDLAFNYTVSKEDVFEKLFLKVVPFEAFEKYLNSQNTDAAYLLELVKRHRNDADFGKYNDLYYTQKLLIANKPKPKWNFGN